MKGSHCFMLKDGTIVDKLSPEEEKKFLDNLRQGFTDTVWQMMQKQRPKQKQRGEANNN